MRKVSKMDIICYFLLLLGLLRVRVAGDGSFKFDSDGCVSCISMLDTNYAGIISNLAIILSNGSEIDMGSILDSNQIVALTEDDTQAPVMSSIKINLDQNGTMIEKVLVGPGKIESETLFIYLDQVVTVTVEIQSDIEVIFGVDYGDSISVSETCGGPISAYKLTHTYATIGVFNLSVEASNMVNNQSSFLSIETVYPINNIHFDDKSTPLLVDPDSVLLFDVIASGTSFPFGKTELMIECGANVTNETFTLTQDGIQTINCTMDEVGNHTIVVTIMSPLDRLELYRRDFRVWDNLTLFTFQPSAEAFAVGNLPSFNYTNPPVFNFDYVIDFGEGTILENNGIEHLRTRYTDITIPVLNYNTSGTYIVSFSASNHAYSKSMSTAVIFEYAIPPSNLQVDITDLLLVPPGLAKFSVYSDSGAAEITPTNVTCTYEFGDGVTITITNCCLLNYDATGLAIVVPYVFTTEGSMNVSFECENRVSSELMFAEVETKLMNVTLIEITHYEFLLMNNSDPITFDIQYNIFNFTIPPVNLTYGITWESTETMKYTEMTRLNDSHVYSVRGNNLLTIYFEYYSGHRTERKYIRSGTVEFILISSRIGQTDTTSIDFTVKRHLLSDDHSISIDWGDGSPDTSRSYTATTIPPQSNPVISTGAPTTESHVFIKAGIFTPVITFSSVRGIEILDLNDTIYIENKIQGLEISTEDRYTFSDTIAPIISMGNTTYPVRNISCYFNYTDAGITVIGDLLDNSTDTIQTVIEYSDLGEKNLLVTCSNYLSEQTLQAVYLVFSVCFDSSRMFDRVYASVSTALKIYSSNPQTITGRSTITDVCKNRTDNIRYTWKLQRFNQSTSTLQDIAISHPNSISFTVLDFTSEPGIYRLELTVFFPEYPDDYITDVMFLQLIDPPLVGNIEFGSKREVSIGIPVNFDAKLSSFDPKIGHDIEDPDLRFSWNCYRIADSAAVDSYTAPYSNDTSYRSAPPCGFTLPSQSIINGIDTAGVQPNSWYLVELEVTKDVRRVTDIQVLYFSNADTPLLGISCQLNCLQKVLSDDITYFHSSITCPSCSPEQLNSVTYSWSVYKYNVITGQDDLLNWVDISSYISTVQSDREFNAKPFLFEEGASYAVELEATIPGKDPTKTTIRFDVNYRPYGGVCEFNTLTGFATVTKFQVTCDGWMDESFRRDRDALIDGGEPVVYRVEQFTRLGTFVVYEGSERSTPPFFLQPCDERDSYDCEVVVKIMDFVRSEANEKFIVNVQAPLDYYLSKARNETNSTDITTDEILEEFYQRIEQDINVTLNYDSFLIGIMTASTYGAVLNTIPLEQSPIEDFGLIQSNDSITARQTIVDSLRIIDPKKQRLQNVMEGVILLFTDTVNKTTRTAPLTLNDILIASSSLASLIDNPEIITGRAQSAISNTAEDLSNSLVAKLETSVIIKDILKTMEAINTLQDKVIDLGGPDMTGKLPNGVDYSNTDWNPEGDGFNPYEQEYFAKLINRRKAADIDRFIENAKETERVCEKIWENSFEIMDKATADNTTFKTINRNFASELTKGTIREILARQRAKTTIAQLMLGNQTGITEGQTGVAGSTESHTGVTGSTEGQTGSTEGQTGSTEGQTGSQTGNTDVQTGSTEGQTGGTGGPSGSTGSPGGQTASTDGSGGQPGDLEGIIFNFDDIIDEGDEDKSADLKTVLVKKNIYTQGENSPIFTEPVVRAAVKKPDAPLLKMKRPRVGYPHSQDTSFVYVADPKFIDEDASLMFYWRFIYRYKHEYVCLSVRPTRLDIKYDMFWRSIVPPSDFEYDKAFIGDEVDDWTEQYDACIAPGDLKRLGAGFVGLRPYQVDPVSRRKRAVANTTQSGVGGNADSDNPLEAPYYIRIMAFNCATWNGVKEDWDPDNCEVEKDLLKNWTTCLCQQDNNQVLTASSFFTPPNSIDFSTVFSKFDIQSQAAVLATILIITLVAILAGLWGHWRDSRDKLQWGVTLLADNYDDDDYYYLVTVYTGLVLGAGTTSNINFNLSGERGDTGIRTLSDGVRKEFETGSVMHFLMAVPQPLGLLQCFRVWHDNSGKGKKASWYLNRIEIHDIQTNDRYDFMCSGWLSVEDGTIERMVHVSGTVNFNNFKTMFYEHARSHVTDDHLWLSVFLRPVKSHFYRSQRVGCCYALLMLTMITNAMFFQIKDQKNRIQPSEIELGPIRFSVNQLYISFVSILITSLPIFLVILLFRKSKLSVKQKKSIREIPSWYPKFMKKQIEHSNKLEEALVIRDIVDDKEGVLPHFCVYFGWFVVFLAAFLSAFFLILYSAEWGQSISEEWLTSFFLSFIQSIVLVDPFKVIVMAVIFAIFLKAIRSNKPTHYDLKEIQLLAKHKGLPNSGRKILKFSSPYSDQQFYQMKLQRERNDRMRKIVKELAVNALFLWFLLSISYSNRDVNSYFLDRYVENNFITPAYKSSGRTFESVGSRETYFEWLNDTVLPRMFKERDYRGYRMVSSARMFSYYLNNFRVGPPRLRQVRTKQTFCDWKYMNESRCIPGYWMTEEDTDTYCIGWTDTPCAEHEKLALTHESWTFTSASDIWGYPISGYHNTYGGGGYIANLDINKLISFESLKELHAARWIDRHTRAVFFEFTLYNVNLNIFVYVTLLTEFPETGGALNFKKVFPFRPSQHEGANAKYVLFCEIALLVYIIIYVIMIIIDLAKERLRYFRSFWNVVEVTMMAVAIITIAMYAIREKFTSDALAKYADNNRLFVNFYHVALWDGIFVMFLGLLTAIATLRLIKALGHSKLTIKIYTVLWQSSRVLPGLAFYIITMLLSFSFAGLLLFGRMSTGYKSFFYCLETLFTAVMGSPYFKHTNTEVQDYWITILYFCLFVVLVGLTMQNLFLAILLDVMAFSENPDVDEAEVDMELISYIWQSFLSVFTGRQPDMERKKGLTALRVHHEEIGVGGTIEDKLKAYKRPHFYKPGANKNKTEVEMELVDDDDSIDELPYISSSFGDNDDDNNDNAYKINDHAKDNGENDKEKTEINDKIKSENESDA